MNVINVGIGEKNIHLPCDRAGNTHFRNANHMRRGMHCHAGAIAFIQQTAPRLFEVPFFIVVNISRVFI